MSNWKPVRDFVQNSDVWTEFIYRNELDSTNRYLRHGEEVLPGTIVLADKQTHGQGSGTRRWYSPEGGLWFSFTLGGLMHLATPELYVELLKLVQALLAEYGVETSVSRPNDLVVEGKKIAGLLIEESSGDYIVGIGINVNNEASGLPEAVRENSITMKDVTGEKVDRTKMLEDFLGKFEDFYREQVQ
ncbi:MAG: biotin--[acetyl-CoA-carboxylase] ligase [Candidatus Bipolaricaulota bacterium]|nr:biotin--[acetyl-CoA-carboxylase] ligase [Candidatus Bipolaricaulota bacterium]MBS3791171.1 biotin--[acetyl-CoA-carboxylase] ligase [Candidatus Bipolaricaulota bacterium]